MAFKINISTKEGKTYKLEVEAPGLMEKSLGDVVDGSIISPDLAGYELEITGTSDKSGFTSMKDVPGFGRKRVLLGYGKGMHKRPIGDKKKAPTSSGGLRLRKTVRGKVISDAIIQINTKIIKEGSKKLAEAFPDQNAAAPAPEEAPQNVAPDNEPKESAPTEGNPEAEPKEAPKAEEEKANPDEEPKQ